MGSNLKEIEVGFEPRSFMTQYGASSTYLHISKETPKLCNSCAASVSLLCNVKLIIIKLTSRDWGDKKLYQAQQDPHHFYPPPKNKRDPTPTVKGAAWPFVLQRLVLFFRSFLAGKGWGRQSVFGLKIKNRRKGAA